MTLPKVSGDALTAAEVNGVVGNVMQAIAGENLTAGNAVYLKKSDGKFYKADNTFGFGADGIAVNTISSGSTVTVQTKGQYTTSGLTANTAYYLSTSGALTTTANAYLVGSAVSTTILNLQIKSAKAQNGLVFITKNVLGGNATSIGLTIPALNYTSLRVVLHLKCHTDVSGEDLLMTVNGDTGASQYQSNYIRRAVGGLAGGGDNAQAYINITNGANLASGSQVSADFSIEGFTIPTSGFRAIMGNCMNYTTAPAIDGMTFWGFWKSTAAVTSLSFFTTSTHNFTTGSEVYVYGMVEDL